MLVQAVYVWLCCTVALTRLRFLRIRLYVSQMALTDATRALAAPCVHPHSKLANLICTSGRMTAKGSWATCLQQRKMALPHRHRDEPDGSASRLWGFQFHRRDFVGAATLSFASPRIQGGPGERTSMKGRSSNRIYRVCPAWIKTAWRG